MLTIGSSDSRNSRRDFLRVGTLGLGGLSLSQMLGIKALGAQSSSYLTEKSVIFVHMHGGPSQFETFDPKPNAAEGIRTIGGEIQTRIPGVNFGSAFPRFAQLADKLAIIRSYVPDSPSHDARPIADFSILKGATRCSTWGRCACSAASAPTSCASSPRETPLLP
ncbi:MAG: DUF1501 domain-containing protein [Planctomycetota bacterium]